MISSLLLRFSPRADRASASQMLSDHPQINVGRLVPPGTLPVAIEAEHRGELNDLHDWIAGLPGVAAVEVVMVYFVSQIAAP